MAHVPEDLVLGVVARRLELISEEGLSTAMIFRSEAQGRPLDQILREMGLLTEDLRQAVTVLVSTIGGKFGEGLLQEARSLLDSEGAAASPQVPRSVEGPEGAADDTIDPLAPPQPGQETTAAHSPDPLGSTQDDPSETAEDYASIWIPPGKVEERAARSEARLGALSTQQNFRLIRPLAQGGLGQVLLARDEVFGREVAIKRILEKVGDNPIWLDRFLLEARITGNLEHPGIVGVYAIGRDHTGRPFYAMRLIRGESLREALRRYHDRNGSGPTRGERTLALKKLINRLVAVCNAVAFAHSRGVLHRDLKPTNILIGKYGETLVVDWGLAKRLYKFTDGDDQGQAEAIGKLDDPASMTLSGMVVGTPAYMSPEQASGRQDLMEPTSDVYSLGATLYEILTGRVPFQGKAVFDIVRDVIVGDFPRPREVLAEVDPALEAICLKAMSHAPEDRYLAARALADDLERWLADEPVSVYREPATRAFTRWLSRHPNMLIRGLAIVVALLLLALLVAVLAMLGGMTRSRDSGSPPAPARAPVVGTRSPLQSPSTLRYRETVFAFPGTPEPQSPA